MPTIQGVRARARAEITAAIMRSAELQLRTEGATGLSLRAIARDLGMVPSAIYRYVASRDELLTMLIVHAYDDLGAAAERAALGSAGGRPAGRLMAVAVAIRAWALANPHRYALIYGSPVPGYEAPGDTVGPASRVSLALVGVVEDAARAGVLVAPSDPLPHLPSDLAEDLDRLRSELASDLVPDTLARVLVAWTQLFGAITFELFGQTRNVITAHDQLFVTMALAMAHFVGLPD